MQNDPYLIPGQVCEVWGFGSHTNSRILAYFETYKNKTFYFKNENDDESWPIKICNYRPIGTEWDFAPDWALDPKNKDVCSMVDADGKLYLYSSTDGIEDRKYEFEGEKTGQWIITNSGKTIRVQCGICPDKTRYEGDAWKTSLRMRPIWAGGKQ